MAEAGVDVVVVALLDHEDLAGVVLLGGCAEELDACLSVVCFEGVAGGDCPRHSADAVDVVAAPVSGVSGREGLLLGGEFLAYAGEGVELSLDADGWFAGSPLGDEGGWHAGDAAFDLEAVLLELVGDEFA